MSTPLDQQDGGQSLPGLTIQDPISKNSAPAVAGRADATRPRSAWPFLSGLLALAIYLAAWLRAGALPMLTHPAWAQLNQPGMDPNFYVWSLQWWPYAISHGLDPLRSALVQAPTGTSLAWTTTVPPLALLAWPITHLAGPIVSFNLLVVASLPVSAWAAFLLCRRITSRFWPSLAGGAIYGICGYETNHIISGQLNLAFAPLLPLIAFLVVTWLDKKVNTGLFVGLLALALAAQFYLFLETFADLTVVLAVALGVGYLLAGKTGRPTAARLTRLVLLAYLLSVAAAAPYIWAALSHVPPGFNRSPTGFDVMNIVVSRSGNVLGLGWLSPHGIPPWPRGCFVGIPILVAAIALAVFHWKNKIVRFLTIMLVFVLIAALGPGVQFYGRQRFALPWRRLWYLPVVTSSFPTRLLVFAFLALAVGAAVWLAAPSRWPWLRLVRWLVVLLAIVTIATNSPVPSVSHGPGVPSFITTGQYRHYLRPGSTVVIVATHTGNAGLLWQADTDFYFRLAGGYLNEAIAQSALPIPVARLLNPGLSPADISQFRSFIRTAKVSAILVQWGSVRFWKGAFAKLGLTPQYVSGVIFYSTTHLPRQGG
jgi:hypothetical protein